MLLQKICTSRRTLFVNLVLSSGIDFLFLRTGRLIDFYNIVVVVVVVVVDRISLPSPWSFSLEYLLLSSLSLSKRKRI